MSDVRVMSLVLAAAMVGCSQPSGTDAGAPSSDSGNDTSALDANTVGDVGSDARSSIDAAETTDAPDLGVVDGGSDASVVARPIYAATTTQLYTFDPVTSAATLIGAFDCIGGTGEDSAMTDIAVDAAGTIYGVSATSVYSFAIVGSAVHCAQRVAIAGSSHPSFYGLAIAPAGVIGTTETLIAATTAGELWAVDFATGALTQHGTFGTVPAMDPQGHTYAHAGTAWELAGDIVFGVGTTGATVAFATLRDCPTPPTTTGCDGVDTLAELDPAMMASPTSAPVVRAIRGQIVRSAGCADATSTGYGSFFGLALEPSQALGFSHTGATVSIDFATGAGCLVTSTASSAWAGAGVSNAIVTSAM